VIAAQLQRPGDLPGTFVAPLKRTVVASGGAKQFPQRLDFGGGYAAMFFADGTDHYDGRCSYCLTYDNGRTWGEVQEVAPSLHPGKGIRHFSVGFNAANGTVAAYLRVEEPTPQNQDIASYYTVCAAANLQIGQWLPPMQYDVPGFRMRGTMYRTSLGMACTHYFNGGFKLLYLNEDFSPSPVEGGFEDTNQPDMPLPGEMRVLRIDGERLVAIVRNNQETTPRYGFHTSADAGMSWTPRGAWIGGTPVDATNQSAAVCHDGQVWFAWPIRRDVGAIKYKRCNAEDFFADPVGALYDAPTATPVSDLAGWTYDKGHPNLVAGLGGRIDLSWYQEHLVETMSIQ